MTIHSIQQFSREQLLANKLMRQLGTSVSPFAGITDQAERKRRARRLILENAISSVGAGKRNGKWINFAQLFELAFGEPLTQNSNGDDAA